MVNTYFMKSLFHLSGHPSPIRRAFPMFTKKRLIHATGTDIGAVPNRLLYPHVLPGSQTYDCNSLPQSIGIGSQFLAELRRTPPGKTPPSPVFNRKHPNDKHGSLRFALISAQTSISQLRMKPRSPTTCHPFSRFRHRTGHSGSRPHFARYTTAPLPSALIVEKPL